MAKFRSRNNHKWVCWIAGILVVALAVGAVFGLASVFNRDDRTIGASEFSVGALDPDTGKFIKSKIAIYTSDAFSAQGLTIKPDFDVEDLTYQVFFYDENDRFIEATDVLSGVYSEEKLYPAYARIVIYPSTIDEDGNRIDDFEVNFFTVRKYAKGLTITVDADQNKTYSANLFEVGETTGVSDYMQISSFDGLLLHLAPATVTTADYTVTFYQEKTTADGTSNFVELDTVTVLLQNYGETEWLWYTVDKIPTGATHATVTYYDTNTNIGVYGIDR